jgi:hypothetical protein
LDEQKRALQDLNNTHSLRLAAFDNTFLLFLNVARLLLAVLRTLLPTSNA